MSTDWLRKALQILVGEPDIQGPPLEYGIPMPWGGAAGAAARTRAAVPKGGTWTARTAPKSVQGARDTARRSTWTARPSTPGILPRGSRVARGTGLTAREQTQAGAALAGGVGVMGGATAAIASRDPRRGGGSSDPVIRAASSGSPAADIADSRLAARARAGADTGQAAAAQRDERARANTWNADTARQAQDAGLRMPALGPSETQVQRFGGPGAVPAQRSQNDPYEEFLQGYLRDLTASWDAQIGAIAGLDPIFRQMGAESQENIGNFFGYAGDVAREGIPVNQEIYDTAQGNVDSIYNNLAGNLQALPQQLVGAASEAAGGAIGGSVAGRVAAATAPFAAAGETSRANASANLTQHSSAGQSYLNNLAGATGAEGAMHQSAVENAMNQQLQLVAYRQAELEGAKQRALMEVSADIAGSSSERMAQAALAEALGLNLDPNVDPMEYLRAQQLMAGLQPDPGDPIKEQRDLIGLQQAELNLLKGMDPNFTQNQIMQSFSNPNTAEVFNNLRRAAEEAAPENPSTGVKDPRAVALEMLTMLDEAVANNDWEAIGLQPGVEGILGAIGGGNQNAQQVQRELENAIRTLLM